jgi:hypothetical protein
MTTKRCHRPRSSSTCRVSPELSFKFLLRIVPATGRNRRRIFLPAASGSGEVIACPVRIVGNPYLIALRQSRGDRAALAYAFVAVVLKPVGTIEQMKMAAVSLLTDFSFDWYPLFTPVSKKSHPSCTMRVTTAGSSKS